ncbi:MAG: hypothetical protein CTY37_04170 [Methylotenera sp.]|nr:hypothetical protein [Methylotenera sp.]OQW68921.1 MAG: hypothetical protein BVN34_05165 [Proteobacteria bacterium ST_bin12]PPC87178.1 MAG: hypothetical protein CTY37_04170 [Methylotenera sp.]
MKIKVPNESYLNNAKNLSDDEKDRLLSRMGSKLMQKLADEKLLTLEAIAIQLEVEDVELADWRKRMVEIKEKENNKKRK